MEKFSQRMGIQQVGVALQTTSINADLRNALWNVFWDNVRWGTHSHAANELGKQVWKYCFNKLEDEAYSGATGQPIDRLFQAIRQHYFTLEWYEIYDFIEFVANHSDNYTSPKFVEACNVSLTRELSAYRFIGKRLAPVTSEQEITEIENAMQALSKFTPHLDRALNLLADKNSPDYANSIKESISAVEATCRYILKEHEREGEQDTLGKALDKLERQGFPFHKDLKDAFKKIYHYTSDAQGIRHGLVGQTDLGVEDARFMLVACSAFVNYLMAKFEKFEKGTSPTSGQ